MARQNSPLEIDARQIGFIFLQKMLEATKDIVPLKQTLTYKSHVWDVTIPHALCMHCLNNNNDYTLPGTIYI